MIEGILAGIGVLALAGVAFLGWSTLWCRLRSGSWWWDDAGDGLESGR